jgi:STE24 endopeptidase
MLNELTIIFVGLLLLGTILQLWLASRHVAHIQQHQQTVPAAFAEKISLEEHQKAAGYTLAKIRFNRKMLVVDTIIVLLWTLGGLLQVVNSLWLALDWSPLWTGVGVLMSFMIVVSLLDLPSAIYHTFYIESHFGFNRTTVQLFVMDMLKSLLLIIVIGIPLSAIILALMNYAGPFWWLGAWMVLFSFNLLMLWAYPIFIAPLFNQFKPLENEELKQRIEGLLQRNGFASKGIFVMDGSKRSRHGNAYFTGLGRNKRIVFFDTLLNELNNEEIEAVLAHEVGHFKNNHLLKRVALMAIFSLAGLALLGWLMQQDWFYLGLGVTTPSPQMALLLFILVVPVFTFFLNPMLAWFSRRHEFEADRFAARQSRPAVLIQALVKLYKENASTLTPDPLYSAFYDSHPPAPVRIANLLKLNS